MPDTYTQITDHLRSAYNSESAKERDQGRIAPWKATERQAFLELLQQEGKTSLLEVGAGPGRDSLFFQQQGLRVTCTDLSPAMVALCREKGLEAHEMDFLSLDFPPASFDAIYALNCLLHVPTRDLPAVLQKLQSLLKPGGLFFLGVYGGIEQEGLADQDWHNPPRFFSYHTDEYMKDITGRYFELVSFKTMQVDTHGGEWHFQALVLRRT